VRTHRDLKVEELKILRIDSRTMKGGERRSDCEELLEPMYIKW